MALRDGYTTGTTAAAAAMAAVLRLKNGSAPAFVDVPLPPYTGKYCRVAIENASLHKNCMAVAEAHKDGGDDPDATHGMVIRARLYARDGPGLEIDGGQGIGRVTLPGLPVPVGAAAINPAPREQIERGLRAVCADLPPLRVLISAPEGVERAKKTMNARLGIVGGISILGTQGIVRPYSNAAYEASIAQALNVAKCCGARHICLGTGRRSVGLLQAAYPGLPQSAFIIAGDFAASALAMAAAFEKISWGCFFGKLIKLAQGLGNTHAHAASLDLEFLAGVCGMKRIVGLNTAQAALAELSLTQIRKVLDLARRQAEKFSGKQITIHLFHTDGRELARA